MFHGVSSPTKPVKLQIAGCTNSTMAGKEANLIAAEQYYRTRHVIFQTDVERVSLCTW